MLNDLIKPFIEDKQLPDDYGDIVDKWFFPLAKQLVLHQKEANKPFVIGINGAQGSGKTTLAELLVHLFQHHYQLKAVSISIDDFYLTQSERYTLAKTIHPLFQTRGVPGTHDIELALSTLTRLLAQQEVAIPRFNKAIDDRFESDDWDLCSEAVDVIVLEGWCLGAEPQANEELIDPINELEQVEDNAQIWRSCINQQLHHQYPRLFDLIDQWIMLKAPSFDCVYHWRLQQEHKLKQQHQLTQSQIMSDEEVKRFVTFYQRITEQLLLTLPEKVHYLFELDQQRNITDFRQPTKGVASQALTQPLLIYTDMDGSLLNHNDYDFSAAKPLLEQLAKLRVPVIPCTSKTAAELIDLRQKLNNHNPFIVENGAAVYIPIGSFPRQPEGTTQQGHFWVKSFTHPRAHWLQILNLIKPGFSNYFRHFSQMSIDEICTHTGLGRKDAIKASKREFGEPVLWLADDEMKQQFIKQLGQHDAETLEGGRFLHISGAANKAVAMNWLTDVYQQHLYPEQKPLTLAIGDSDNDIAMLEAADIALIIRSPAHDLPILKRQQDTYVSGQIAPEGWRQGVEEILSKLTHKMESNNG